MLSYKSMGRSRQQTFLLMTQDIYYKAITRLTRRRSPSCWSNNSRTARKEKEMEKNMVAWQQPEAWEHSRSHKVYFTTSERMEWGSIHT